jgi:hypothetical protein
LVGFIKKNNETKNKSEKQIENTTTLYWMIVNGLALEFFSNSHLNLTDGIIL